MKYRQKDEFVLRVSIRKTPLCEGFMGLGERSLGLYLTTVR